MTFRGWWSRLRGTVRRDVLEREMRQEMEYHLERAAARNISRGMTPDAAMRQARLAFGSAEEFRESGREAARARVVENIASDTRFALRSLRRSPAFTTAAIATMALGIGSSTALFTVVNGVLLRPLPIPHPDEFTYIGWVWPKGGDIPALTSLQYEFARTHTRALAAIATYRPDEAYLGGDGATAQPTRGLAVAGDFFTAVGFAPRIGRSFDARELQNGEPVVILGDDVWRTRFGADPGILGKPIRIADTPHVVIGVLPPEFRFPPSPQSAGYVVPFVVEVNPGDEGHNTNAIGRFKSGTSTEERDAEVRTLTQTFRAANPSLAAPGETFRLFTQTEVSVEASRRQMIWVLFGAVSLVLLIACANTATLLLVRASARQREIAVRASLGASPLRILQQLSTEALVLSLTAAAIGLAIGVVAVRAFVGVAPNVLPVGADLGIDTRVLSYAIGVSMITGVVFGLIAAGPAFRARMYAGLLSGARGASSGNTRLREILVFLETAVAVVLLCGAVLLAASFARLTNVDAGFDPTGVVVVRLGRLPPGYDATRRDQLVNRLLERLRALPGVEQAAAAPSLPFERGRNFPVDIAERPDLGIGAVELRFVSAGYLATLGIPLRGGRDFSDADVAGTEPIAIVNEAFSKHFWSDARPLGRTIQIGHFRHRWINPKLEAQTRVVGVGGDIREVALDKAPKPTVLLPRREGTDGTPLLLVRGGSRAIASALRGIVAAEDAQLSPTIESLVAVRERSVAGPRFRMLLIGAFAAFALLLAGVGTYGVIASVVQQRHREIGLRIALGASRSAVAAAVVRRCLANVTAGTVAGLVVFWVTRRVLTSMLYQVSPGDPRVLTATVGVLGIATALASVIPARRATRIDPAISLRMD